MQISTYVLLFFLYSFIGWVLEVVCKLITHKKFVNRGFLIGPYCPIYGVGTLFMSIILDKYINDPITLFIMIILSCSILEYITSFILEKLFRTRWWDYSTYRFNINGRICLETMIPFGFIGLFIMHISNPFFIILIEKLPDLFAIILATVILVLFIIDCIASFQIINSLKNVSKDIKKDSTEKVTEQVRKIIKKQNKLLQKRILNAFPNLKFKGYIKKRKDKKK